MNTEDNPPTDDTVLNNPQRAAIAVVAALESGLTTIGTAADGCPTMTFQFHGEEERQAAYDAWRNYALALVDVSAPPACTAAQRATTRLGQALFGDPTLDLTRIADMVATARATTPAAFLPVQLSEVEEPKDGRG